MSDTYTLFHMGDQIAELNHNNESLEKLQIEGRQIMEDAHDEGCDWGTAEIYSSIEDQRVWALDQADLKAERKEAAEANRRSWSMLEEIHREIAPILKDRRQALANGHNPAKQYECV